MNNQQSKALALGYLIKVSTGNINASHTEGNVVIAKKVTLPDGSSVPYFSGQAKRRMLRDRLEDLGFTLSEVAAQVSGQEVSPPVQPWQYIDEDLFGYMDPSGSRRRTSPVRVSAGIGVFPFQGDRDLGTRSFERFGQAMSTGGNMFETELYANLFKGNMLVELDRVGVFSDLELGNKPKDIPAHLEKIEKNGRVFYALPLEERKRRLKALLEALGLLWGGGRTARMLSDLSPRFVAYSRLSIKHPVFLEALQVSYSEGRYELILEPLISALQKFSNWRQNTLFGIEKGFFSNEEEIRQNLEPYGKVMDLYKAIQEAQKDVESL
ncbi:type I-B CRISPR-associated protein Cas7/Cst2/DevR [Caldanaerobacter subterraneus]|uniref:Type I-B CRISPR-associated protein Cas7/Cst2/DevR n=1 Tax=Caldanaerobacter subterraneus TaxID=911092 RepID=A0A7Y2L5S5_9THEO|nr:type I-B CRISPR-associated protein Cas7/Cst2/DevR [Caldanaerobacter subterraneus]NNG65737.1 type I-B CRISPR-associated protein Cas7/Cst2/DevR [Caldanaerobacter subterraneus]